MLLNIVTHQKNFNKYLYSCSINSNVYTVFNDTLCDLKNFLYLLLNNIFFKKIYLYFQKNFQKKFLKNSYINFPFHELEHTSEI